MNNLRNNFGIARSILLLATAITMSVFATNVTAQEITASIQGTVLGPDGQAIAGATATVRSVLAVPTRCVLVRKVMNQR